MRLPTTRQIVSSVILLAAGLASFIAGAALVIHGSDAPNEGRVNTTGGPGVLLVLLGLLLFFGTIAGWLIHITTVGGRQYKAWKATLTPQERNWVTGGELAALTAAAYAGHRAVKAYGHQIGQRYMEDQARSAANDALIRQAIYGNGPAGQPPVQQNLLPPFSPHHAPQGYWD